jgi:hypothetical protein
MLVLEEDSLSDMLVEPPHFHSDVMYLNHKFPDKWIGRGSPISWPSCSHNLTPVMEVDTQICRL